MDQTDVIKLLILCHKTFADNDKRRTSWVQIAAYRMPNSFMPLRLLKSLTALSKSIHRMNRYQEGKLISIPNSNIH